MKTGAIYSKRCWLEGQLQEAVIHFSEGIINHIQKGAPENFINIHNAGNAVVMPGAIDAHVHINEPGRTDWEGFETATAAAAAGGVTTLVDMPLNSSPVTTTQNALRQKLEASRGKLVVNCGFYGGLVPGNLSEMEGLSDSGVLGIKAFLTHSGIDEFPNVEEAHLREAMPLLARLGLPLLVHCELSDAEHSGELEKRPTSYPYYLARRPKEWEDKAVALMIRLCRETGCRVHIVHVSSATSLALIQQAKREGLPLTAETGPHYIFFDAEAIPDGQTMYKCAPPIREAANNALLKEALKNGVLDFIATDHSPAPPEIKEFETGNLRQAWGGIAGLQFFITASWTALKDMISIESFIPLVTEHPAAFLSLQTKKGFLKEGADADLVIWSPDVAFTVEKESILHRHKASPYSGRELWGEVKQTWVGGELVYDNGTIINHKEGKWLLRK